jgi:hypothetical protein
MKKLNIMVLVWLTIITTVFTGCKDDENVDIQPNEIEFGTVSLKFQHFWVSTHEEFNLNQPVVHPRTNDTLQFTIFKYYISNLELQAEDGTWLKMPESYFLVDVADPDAKLEIKNVPLKDYKALRFIHGVDSARNNSGIQEGALSPSNGMFWSWNSGYIMIKAEGNSPQSSTGKFAFHLGGFKGENNVITSRNLEFGSTLLNVKKDNSPKIYINVNPARLWHSTKTLANTETTIMMPGPQAKQMATDLFTWTRLDKIEN